MLPNVSRLDIRQDISDLIRLIRFVESHREAAVQSGTSTADADALLRTLRGELRAALRYRRMRPRRPAAAPLALAVAPESGA
ncbi:MAG: hypothetical protein HY332_12905 [Chloroflexi bacterium]|nr:hypothetical protein [Chloroflexota bacterium]